MSTAVPSATSERERVKQVGKTDVQAGQVLQVPMRLTAILWWEEVQVPKFLPLSTNGAP